METTIVTFGAVGLAAVIVAIVRTWRVQATTTSRLHEGRRSSPWKFNAWFDSDPVLFVGVEVAPADCGGAGDPGCP